MTWTVGVQPAGREVLIEVAASNGAPFNGTADTYPPLWQSDEDAVTPRYTAVDLTAANTAVKLSVHKEVAQLTDSPVVRTWGDCEPIGVHTASGELVLGVEGSLARYLADRGRRVAFLKRAIGLVSVAQYATTHAAALEAFVLSELAALGESYTVRGIFIHTWLADADDETNAAAIGTNMTTVCQALCTAIGAPAASAAWFGLEPSAYVESQGTYGATAKAALTTWRNTPVAGHAKFLIPTRAALAADNDTGEDMDAMTWPNNVHPFGPTFVEMGQRWGKILVRHVLPMFSRP